jgi:hypothetical protein
MAHISAWNSVCNHRIMPCPLFKPHPNNPTPVSLLVLERSLYQNRPFALSVLKRFCHLYLSQNLTVNGLWYEYGGIAMSAPICRTGSCCTFWHFLYHDWNLCICVSTASCMLVHKPLLGHLPPLSQEVKGSIHRRCSGRPHRPCDSQCGQSL